MTELRRKVIFLLRGVPDAESLADVLIDVISADVRRTGGRPRKVESDVSDNLDETSELTTLSLNSDPSPVSGTPDPSKPNLRKSALDEPPGFLEFWGLYPKKVAKAAARRAWLKGRPSIVKVREALAWQLRSRQWVDGYAPHPATWINGEEWDNEPGSLDGPAPKTPAGRAPGAPAAPSPYCEFHERKPWNNGKPAAKHDWRASCPECKHAGVRAHPRAPSEPSSTGDLLKAIGGPK